MRRAYESTKSLEERMRGSKPNTAEVAVHSIRFYSKDLHEYNPTLFIVKGIWGGERGNEGKEIVNPEGIGGTLCPGLRGVTNVIVFIYRSGTAARGAHDEGETKDGNR